MAHATLAHEGGGDVSHWSAPGGRATARSCEDDRAERSGTHASTVPCIPDGIVLLVHIDGARHLGTRGGRGC